MAFTKTYTVQPLAPFSLVLSAQIFLGPENQVRTFADGMYSQVMKIEGSLVLVKVTSEGTVEKPKLRIELASNQPITADKRKAAQAAIEYIFNLNFDLNLFYIHVENDPVIHKITRLLCGFKYPTTATAFESLVDSIVEQQISIKVARAIENRLSKKFGDTIEIDNTTYYAFPTPQNLAQSSITDIRSCGLSQRKAEYIYGAAKMITEGKLNLEEMKHNPDLQEVIAELDELKGIGVWTAELTIFRGMQRLDVLPADDFGIRRVISNYYCGGMLIKSAEAREIAEAWGKWSGLAAFYLLSAEANGITF